jgi:serine beta-lactamase-like protein LACTB, mitochondrial
MRTKTTMNRVSVAVACGVWACCAPRPSVAPASSAAATREVDSARVFVRALVEGQRLPGFAITVSLGQRIVWHEGFGFADVNALVKATPQTKFRIGSVSKLLTATLLMRLVEGQRVQLDAPIGQSLTLPAQLTTVTLRQLAGHLAGIRHYRGNEFLTTTHFATLREALAVFADDSLIAVPGSRYAYSSYGYNLIGAVLEAVTATLFSDLVRREVLAPLGMTATVADVAGVPILDRAQTYTITSAGIAPAPHDDLSGRWPSGGFLSSTDDLVRLGRSVLVPGLLSERSLLAMLTPQRLTSGAPATVGIGWRLSVDSVGRRYVHHGGSSNGGAAFLLVYPDQQLVIAMASNAFAQWGERDALAIASVFLAGS